MLRYLTAGESHGKEMRAILEGMPSGLPLKAETIDVDLARRQGGYGRGDRMAIEKDRVEITAGVRHGKTLGSPISLRVENRDWANWTYAMNSAPVKGSGDKRRVARPRPGHADLDGSMKYDHDDIRNVLERSSARETAARVAVGGVAKRLLDEFGITIYSWVREIGGIGTTEAIAPRSYAKAHAAAEKSQLRSPDKKVEKAMIARIDKAKKEGDSLGGIFEIVATGVPPGLGSHVHWDRKLDARLAMALMSVQATKGVDIGMGFDCGRNPGSIVQDEIFYKKDAGGKALTAWPIDGGFYRKTNNAGGIEGGTSNGSPIVVRAAMKPIPTLYKPLRSVDIDSKRAFKATVERSDVCAVPAASVVAEAVVAFELAAAFLEKFGGDSIKEIKRNYRGYLKQLRDF